MKQKTYLIKKVFVFNVRHSKYKFYTLLCTFKIMDIAKINLAKINEKSIDKIYDILKENYKEAPCEINFQALEIIHGFLPE